MVHSLAAEILTGDSEEISDLNANLAALEGFIALARRLDALPDLDKRFYEESRSLYQATSVNRDIATLEAMLVEFFGRPAKPAGKALSRKLSKESTITYLGGIQKDQSLFLFPLKTGTFYAALWPWRLNKTKIEIHLGYCSDWMSDADYQKLETFIQRSLSRSAMERMETQVGGQIHGIGLPSFLQMAEMELASFTLRITAKDKVGQLYIVEGRLAGAFTGVKNGTDAAYEIISWENAAIEIIPPAEYSGAEINQPLMHILMESLKLKDEDDEADAADLIPLKTRPDKKEEAVSQEHKRLVRLERAPEPQLKKPGRALFKKAILFLCLLAVFGSATWAIWRYTAGRSAATFADIMKQVQAVDAPDQKLAILESHQKATDQTALREKINAEIEKVNNLAEEWDYEQLTFKVGTLPIDGAYEKTALAIFGDFLQRHPLSPHADQIEKTIRKIKNIVDQYYYDDPQNAAGLKIRQRLEVYQQFRNQLEDPSCQQKIDSLIDEISRGYLNFIRSQELQCEQSRRWDPCIELYDGFIADFEDSPLAQEAEAMKADMLAGRNLKQLSRSGPLGEGEDQKALAELAQYLAGNPNTPRRKAIEREMAQLKEKIDQRQKWFKVRDFASSTTNPPDARLQQLEKYLTSNRGGPYTGEAQAIKDRIENEILLSQRQRQVQAQRTASQTRLEQEKEAQLQRRQKTVLLQRQVENQLAGSTRYRANGDGTFTDLTTGLTWSLLDSYQDLGHCVDYSSALRYVSQLRLGGRAGWRLPTANELAAIYKQKPFFPGSGTDWYWTSQAYSRGFHSVADVVTTRAETIFERRNKVQTACGAVRAVRP